MPLIQEEEEEKKHYHQEIVKRLSPPPSPSIQEERSYHQHQPKRRKRKAISVQEEEEHHHHSKRIGIRIVHAYFLFELFFIINTSFLYLVNLGLDSAAAKHNSNTYKLLFLRQGGHRQGRGGESGTLNTHSQYW